MTPTAYGPLQHDKLIGAHGRGLLWLLLAAMSLIVGAVLGLTLSDTTHVALALLLALCGLLSSVLLVPQALRSLRALDLMMSGAHDGLFEWNPRSKRLKVSQRLLAILGYTEDFLTSSDAWLEIVHPDDREKYNRSVSRHLKGETDHFYCEYRVRGSDGRYRWLAARGLAIRNRRGVGTLMAGSVSDITARVEHEERVRELALNDQLTGLPNRRSLMERLPAVLAEARRSGEMVAVIFIDLDRFKHVNDSYGHLFGDLLLVEIARRLPVVLRAYDTLIRQGGDELTVLLSGLSDRQEACHVGQRLLELINQPLDIEGKTLRISASVGIALFPEDGTDSDTLLRSADLAMYSAKAAGGNRLSFFESRMREQIDHRVALENRLQSAIERGDLLLHFQPQRRFADGSLCGAEALVRWQDGDRLVRPDQFIPLAEEIGLIEPLGRLVMDKALAQFAEWREHLPPDFVMSINLSPRQFQLGDVQAALIDCCRRHGVPHEHVGLEVTESVLLHPETGAIRTLNSLHASGFRIALDDFGTGYSSLSYLQLLDIDCLKIDKSFVGNLDLGLTARGARNGAAIVSAMIALAHRLGYEVVAEGVESGDQHEWLKMVGCDHCQGYFFHPPLSAQDFEQRLLASMMSSTA